MKLKNCSNEVLPMMKYVLFSLFPSMFPSILLYFFSTSKNSFFVLFKGIGISLINPVTYIFAFGLGYIAYKNPNLIKRLLLQTFGMSILFVIPIYIMNYTVIEYFNRLVELLAIFGGLIVISLFLGIFSLAIEKFYFNIIKDKT